MRAILCAIDHIASWRRWAKRRLRRRIYVAGPRRNLFHRAAAGNHFLFPLLARAGVALFVPAGYIMRLPGGGWGGPLSQRRPVPGILGVLFAARHVADLLSEVDVALARG